jgi:hypothetical protein
MKKIRKAMVYGRIAVVTVKAFVEYQLFYKKHEGIV